MLTDKLKAINSSLPILAVANSYCVNDVPTQFGLMPIGSPLSLQCSLMPPNFDVYNTIVDSPSQACAEFRYYPPFLFQATEDSMSDYVKCLSDIKKLSVLRKLHENVMNVVEIEKGTRDQLSNPEWFMFRKNRFTASLCNKLGKHGPKTSKGLTTLAHNMVYGDKKQDKNKLLQFKLSYGRYNEPIAIQHYEQYLKLKNHVVVVEPSGFVIDPVNYILGATPDGKVFCDGQYGIIEVKCSEEYKNIDPKDICFISKNPFIVYDDTSNEIKINKEHTYYDQIQMQLALTCRTWCNLIFYTSKGVVIDRVPFNKEHWGDLRKKVINFYFHFMLDSIVSITDESTTTSSN